MKRIGTMFPRLACAALALGFSLPGLAAVERWKLNMTAGVTEVSQQVYDIHMTILWICIVIGVLVFGVMVVAMFRFRKSRGAVAATWSHNDKAEVVLTIIPVLILVAMAWPATKVLINMADTRDAEMTIEVTGYQWKWGYRYVDSGVSFISSLERKSDDTRQLGSGLRSGQGQVLPARRRPSAGDPGRHQGALRHHLRRCHPLLVGAGARLEAGRDPRNHQRPVDAGEAARLLSRPVRRTVRQGSRLHADRGRGEAEGRVRAWLAAQQNPGAAAAAAAIATTAEPVAAVAAPGQG